MSSVTVAHGNMVSPVASQLFPLGAVRLSLYRKSTRFVSASKTLFSSVCHFGCDCARIALVLLGYMKRIICIRVDCHASTPERLFRHITKGLFFLGPLCRNVPRAVVWSARFVPDFFEVLRLALPVDSPGGNVRLPTVNSGK